MDYFIFTKDYENINWQILIKTILLAANIYIFHQQKGAVVKTQIQGQRFRLHR